jgi:methionyl-tRNA formyltransferase
MSNKIKVVVLTSLRFGSASVCLKELIQSPQIILDGVVFSRQIQKKSKAVFIRKLKKVFKIGLLGSLNGIRMRSWFGSDIQQLLKIEDIEKICSSNGVRYFEVEYINSDETRKLLSSLNSDIGVSLGNSYIAPSVFRIPRFGMLNLHGEILPEFQNAQSVIWQLYFGNSNTGYTIHKIEKKIDTGQILKQEVIPIQFHPSLRRTVAITCSTILLRAASGLREVLEHFNKYQAQARPQEQGKSYTTPSFWQFLKIVRQFKKLKVTKGS